MIEAYHVIRNLNLLICNCIIILMAIVCARALPVNVCVHNNLLIHTWTYMHNTLYLATKCDIIYLMMALL